MKKPTTTLFLPSHSGDSTPGLRTKRRRCGWRMMKEKLLWDSDRKHRKCFRVQSDRSWNGVNKFRRDRPW
ncbi:hypothetical protein A4A49_04161 [Nicotiana attenuata]|uniref:Uncharacterized protein n=1 Tax=Nicotiana attenuata TaxID=49451 RepID=A0A314L9G9_NICAT|nr:hypothetical protein A4A49_04161 [Nicotiana attenuata]